MVKSARSKEDCDISATQTICSDTDIFHNETLGSMIDKMPRLTHQERRQAIRLHHRSNSNSKKWSQAQTRQFYELLHHYGLDFTLMSYHPFFSKRRSQKQLSNKYRKQYKMNSSHMTQVLNRIERDGLYSSCKDGYKM